MHDMLYFCSNVSLVIITQLLLYIFLSARIESLLKEYPEVWLHPWQQNILKCDLADYIVGICGRHVVLWFMTGQKDYFSCCVSCFIVKCHSYKPLMYLHIPRILRCTISFQCCFIDTTTRLVASDCYAGKTLTTQADRGARGGVWMETEVRLSG